MSGKKAAYIIGCVFMVVLSVLAFSQRDFLSENPLRATHAFAQPSFAVTAQDGTLLVVEKSKTSLSVLRDGKVAVTISGGKSEGGFYYAEYAAADAEYLYVADVRLSESGSGVEAERIMRYTRDGRFDSVLFQIDYGEDMPLQYGNIRSLQAFDGVLTFLLKSEDALELYSLVQGVPSYIRSVKMGEAEGGRHLYYNAAADAVCMMTMRGELFVEKDGALSLLRSWAGDGMACVPWEIASDRDGVLYVTDLSRRCVARLPEYKSIFKTGQVAHRLSINENDVMTLTDGESVFQVGCDGTVFFGAAEAPYSAQYLALRLLIWLSAVAAGLALAYVAARLLAWLVRSNQKAEFKILVMIIVSTILTSSIVAASILGTDARKLEEKTRLNLTQMACSLSETSRYTFGDDLASINLLSDYGGAAFRNIRAYLDPASETAGLLGGNMYYVLYKYQGNILYGVMDYEDTSGTIYPVGDFYGSGYDEVASGAVPYLFRESSDAYGTWSFAVAPVYGSDGGITGLLEVGSDLYGETLQRRQQIQDISVSTAVLLVLFLLLFSEFMSGFESVARYKTPKGAPFAPIPELIRPLTFLVFLADNTGAAFLPQLSARIFEGLELGVAQTVGAALPISVKTLFVALMAFAGGALIDRWGTRKILIGGLLAQVLGFVLTAAAVFQNNFFLLLLGEGVMGCGLGIVVVSGNTLPVYCAEEQRRNDLFSGVNVGVVAGVVVGVSVGSYAAQLLGYAMTFLLSAVILLPAIVLGLLCADNRRHAGEIAESQVRGGAGMGAFLKNCEVWSFLLLLMLPFLIMMSFKDYVFPLFASSLGYSDISIGHVLLFSGALSIFAAPALSDFLLKRLGAVGTNLLAAGLFILAIFLFALFPTLGSSVLVVYLLSFAGCFGLVAQGILFSSLRASGQFGIGKSMGVFSLFDNLSQTLGPIVFGGLLIFGSRAASLILALVALVALLGFTALNRRNLRPEAKSGTADTNFVSKEAMH